MQQPWGYMPQGSDAWYYSIGGQQLGPVPLHELRRLLVTGQIGPNAPVWMQGAVAPLTAGQAVGDVPVAPGADGMQFIIPTAQTSGMALAAGYLGIFGFFFCPLGIAGLVTGLLALRDLKRSPHKNGAVRAWTGIVLGALQIVMMIVWAIVVAMAK
jgi:hypothetical protein